MDGDEVDALLRLFATKITNRFDVVECNPQRAVVVVQQCESVHRLHFDRRALARDVAQAGESAWGPGVDRLESAARLMTVHLDESLATREPHASGCWTYDKGGFDPRPPWLRGPYAQE